MSRARAWARTLGVTCYPTRIGLNNGKSGGVKAKLASCCAALSWGCPLAWRQPCLLHTSLESSARPILEHWVGHSRLFCSSRSGAFCTLGGHGMSPKGAIVQLPRTVTPNSAPHRDGREASHFGQRSRAPARGRER